jgi:hypothetical protein
MTDQTTLSFKQVLAALDQGHKVKLPEWTGYWFADLSTPEHLIKVLTRTGDILDTPWLEALSTRDDWQITDGSLGFDFALLALKAGKCVARKRWNDKGMWLTIIKPGNAVHTSSKGGFPMLECIGMKTADGKMCPGWLASQTDMLAEDWEVIA